MLAINVLVFVLLFVFLSGKIKRLKIAKTDPKKVNCLIKKLINKKEELSW
jgi:hypothetical protein